VCRCTIEICLGCWVYSFLGGWTTVKRIRFVQGFDFGLLCVILGVLGLVLQAFVVFHP
jgi:hypothetical protein